MCGIVAVFNHRTEREVDHGELLRMRDRMTTRGPDGCGVWYSSDRRVGLGHRRLAIIDLSESGAQPMIAQGGDLAITYNGEIYNYKELRAGLEAEGYRFRSSSDTEVLLQLYAARGAEMVRELRGMYALALWDGQRRGLLLARDPFGIKPLYYADDGKSLRVASQVKALLAGAAVDTRAEPAGHVGFFLWGHVPEPYTLFRGIRCLPAGSTLWVEQDKTPRLSTPCSVGAEIAQASRARVHLGGPEQAEALRAQLLESVRHHLIADVPVGVFLSAGLDSTTLAALASELTEHLHTATLGFEEFRGTASDEAPVAEEVARKYGTVHRTVHIRREDFRRELPRLLDAMDQPTVDGVNAFFVSRAATEAGLKVAISGLGGDELFGGYPSFSQLPRTVRLLQPFSLVPGPARLFRVITARLAHRLTSPKYAGLFEFGGTFAGAYLLRRGLFMPWELPDVLDPDVVRDGWRELDTLARLDLTTHGCTGSFHKVSALEMVWYMRNQLLRDVDWASMAHSLEVRVPFLDLPLLRAVGPWLGERTSPGKRDMARTPATPLPDHVERRGKTGFLIPVREWLLADEPARDRGIRSWAQRVYRSMGTSDASAG